MTTQIEKAIKEAMQRLDESGTGEAALIDTIHAAYRVLEAALEAPHDEQVGAPLLRRFTDAHGNKLVEVAEWFYDQMVDCLPDDEVKTAPSIDGLEEAIESASGWIESDGFVYSAPTVHTLIRAARAYLQGRTQSAVPDGYALLPLEWPEEKHREIGYALGMPSPANKYEALVKIFLSAQPLPVTAQGQQGWMPIDSCPDGKRVWTIKKIVMSDGYFEPEVLYRNGKYWFREPGERSPRAGGEGGRGVMGTVTFLYGEEPPVRFEVFSNNGRYYIKDNYWEDISLDEMMSCTKKENADMVCQQLNKKVKK